MKRFLSVLLIALCLVAFVSPAHAFHGVEMSYASSGSSGISIGDNTNIQALTGNFTLVWKGSLPDWTPAATVTLISKAVAGTDHTYLFRSDTDATLVLTLYRGSGTNFSSTSAHGLTDGTTHELVAVVTRETAGADGSVVFYVDGAKLGDTKTITAAATDSLNSSRTLYISGNNSVRTASTTQRSIFYNRALSASEVSALYTTGSVATADQWGSQTALTSGTLTVGKKYRINTYNADDDFTNIGAASNAAGVEFVATGTTPTHWAHSSSLVLLGATIDLEPTGITATDWQDASSNNLDASYPATGWRAFYRGLRGMLGVGQ